jgi:hypothetical protein
MGKLQRRVVISCLLQKRVVTTKCGPEIWSKSTSLSVLGRMSTKTSRSVEFLCPNPPAAHAVTATMYCQPVAPTSPGFDDAIVISSDSSPSLAHAQPPRVRNAMLNAGAARRAQAQRHASHAASAVRVPLLAVTHCRCVAICLTRLSASRRSLRSCPAPGRAELTLSRQ